MNQRRWRELFRSFDLRFGRWLRHRADHELRPVVLGLQAFEQSHGCVGWRSRSARHSGRCGSRRIANFVRDPGFSVFDDDRVALIADLDNSIRAGRRTLPCSRMMLRPLTQCASGARRAMWRRTSLTARIRAIAPIRGGTARKPMPERRAAAVGEPEPSAAHRRACGRSRRSRPWSGALRRAPPARSQSMKRAELVEGDRTLFRDQPQELVLPRLGRPNRRTSERPCPPPSVIDRRCGARPRPLTHSSSSR